MPSVNRIVILPGSAFIHFVYTIPHSKNVFRVTYITKTQKIYQPLEPDMIKMEKMCHWLNKNLVWDHRLLMSIPMPWNRKDKVGKTFPWERFEWWEVPQKIHSLLASEEPVFSHMGMALYLYRTKYNLRKSSRQKNIRNIFLMDPSKKLAKTKTMWLNIIIGYLCDFLRPSLGKE